MNSEDYVLTDIEWFIKYMASFDMSRAQATERYQAMYSPLIEFMRSNGLLSNPDYKVEDWSKFVLMNSDLTEEGGNLYGLCEGRWLRSIDRGKKNLSDMRMWEKELKKMRGIAH